MTDKFNTMAHASIPSLRGLTRCQRTIDPGTDRRILDTLQRSEQQWHEARIAEVVALMRRFGVTVEEVVGVMGEKQ